MALAFAVTPIPIKLTGGYKIKLVDITFDATYAAGGYAVTAANCGLTTAITALIPSPIASAADTGFVPVWDSTNSKIKVYKAGTADAPLNEADTNQASITGVVSRCLVIGY